MGRLRCPSVRHPSTISNDFSSETTGPIATKFHIQPPGPLGKKSCSNGLGHMVWVDLDPFYAQVKFCHIGFVWEKVKFFYFLETIAALGLKVA